MQFKLDKQPKVFYGTAGETPIKTAVTCWRGCDRESANVLYHGGVAADSGGDKEVKNIELFL